MALKSNTRWPAPRRAHRDSRSAVGSTSRARGQGHPRRTPQAPPSPHKAGGGPLTNNDTHVTARQHSDQIDSTHSLSRLSTLSEPNSRYLALSLARRRKAHHIVTPVPPGSRLPPFPSSRCCAICHHVLLHPVHPRLCARISRTHLGLLSHPWRRRPASPPPLLQKSSRSSP